MLRVIVGIAIGAIGMFGVLCMTGHKRKANAKPSQAVPVEPETTAPVDEPEETVHTIITPSPVVEAEDGTTNK